MTVVCDALSDAEQALSVLQNVYYPECNRCELVESFRASGICPSAEPTSDFSGLMIVGEGPGHTEIRTKIPFTGTSGRLLDDLLRIAGVARESVVIANATLCVPPKRKSKSLHEEYPTAIRSCLPRLEWEIRKWAPRVILGLGQAALIALTGYDEERARRVANPCTPCADTREVGPVIACSARDCTWTETGKAHRDTIDDWARMFVRRQPTCPACGRELKPKARMVKCPVCDGRKTKVVVKTMLKSDHKISWTAGGVFRAADVPSRLDEFGVEYIVVTYHPAYMLRKASTRGDKQIGGQFVAHAAAEHIKKAVRLLRTDAQWECPMVSTRDPEVVAEYTSDPDAVYGVDIETDNKNPYDVTEITCVGIASNKRRETLVVDTHWEGPESVGDLYRLLAFPALRDFLCDPAKKKVFQNRAYDELTLELCWNVVVDGTVGDTMLAHHALYPDEQHDLHKIVFRYTDAPPWKPPRVSGGKQQFASKQELFEYNARDTRGTIEAWPFLVSEMAEANVSTIHDIDLEMTTIALQMRRTGLAVDVETLTEIGDECRDKAAAALVKLRAVAGPEFNPRSPKQLQWALFDRSGPIKLTPTVMTPTGQPSTAKEVLARITKVPFVHDLMEYRDNAYVVSTFVEGKGMTIREDGRIHPEWKPTGARTGRWSSSPNFQNWPLWLRRIIYVLEGRKIVGADMDQLEMRIMAALSGDPDLMARCRNADPDDKLNPDADPHSYVAAMAFGEAFTELDPRDPNHDPTQLKCACEKCKRKMLRDGVKRVVYGLNYGAGADRILNVIYDAGYTGPPLTVTMVHSIITTYFNAFPGVPLWREAVVREANETREIRSPILGRRRLFPLGDIDTTVCYNFPIQSGAADIVNLRMLDLHNGALHIDPTAELIAQVHDAFYLECAAEHAEAVAAHVEKVLTCEYLGMQFSAGAKIGQTWHDVS